MECVCDRHAHLATCSLEGYILKPRSSERGFFFGGNMQVTRALLESLLDSIDDGDDFDMVLIAKDHDEDSLSMVSTCTGGLRDELIGHAVAMTRGSTH